MTIIKTTYELCSTHLPSKSIGLLHTNFEYCWRHGKYHKTSITTTTFKTYIVIVLTAFERDVRVFWDASDYSRGIISIMFQCVYQFTSTFRRTEFSEKVLVLLYMRCTGLVSIYSTHFLLQNWVNRIQTRMTVGILCTHLWNLCVSQDDAPDV